MGMGMYGYRDRDDCVTGSELASYHFMLGFVIWAREQLGPQTAFMRYAGPDGMYVSFSQHRISGSLAGDADACDCGDLDGFRADLDTLATLGDEFPDWYAVILDRIRETVMDPRVILVRVT